MFCFNFDDESKFFVFKDVYVNKFFFWFVIIGGFFVFFVVYIFYFNYKFFKYIGIIWEWVFCVVFIIVFVVGIEVWKFVKWKFGLL